MDKIVYLLVTIGGGCDGMDSSDKGGQVVCASFDEKAITRKKGRDSRYIIDKQVVNTDDIIKQGLKKLSPIERLLISARQR